jgi:hypothetical protein
MVSNYDVVRITLAGQMQVLAPNIGKWRFARFIGFDTHAVMGLWSDQRSNVYVAFFADSAVYKVSSSGEVTVAAQSEAPWHPTGGLVAPNGDLWILEYSGPTRVRRISPNGSQRVY